MIIEANLICKGIRSTNFNCVHVFYGEPLVHPRDFDDRAPLVLRTRTGCPVSPIDLSSETIYEGESPWTSSQSTGEMVDRTCGHPENGVSWSKPSVSTNLWHVIKKSIATKSPASLQDAHFVNRKLRTNLVTMIPLSSNRLHWKAYL